jgi:hypothetical protein
MEFFNQNPGPKILSFCQKKTAIPKKKVIAAQNLKD